MREIIFTEDFATKKEGDSFKCDGATASHLVRVAQVAEYTDAPDKSNNDDSGETIIDKTKKGFGKIFSKKQLKWQY